jgi:hypothetical protein
MVEWCTAHTPCILFTISPLTSFPHPTLPYSPQPAPPTLPPLPAPQVIQLAFLVACLYTGVGVLRLGFLVRFLSHSVITGFTSGAAITIALSQVCVCVCGGGCWQGVCVQLCMLLTALVQLCVCRWEAGHEEEPLIQCAPGLGVLTIAALPPRVWRCYDLYLYLYLCLYLCLRR